VEPFQPELGVLAAAIVPVIVSSPAFDVLFFDPEGCITQSAALRSAVAQIGAAIDRGEHFHSPA
jgi:hypothetical protein